MTMVRRSVAQMVRLPQKLIGVTIMPVIFVVLFAYVFGSAIRLPGGGNYRDFLMPGVFTQSLAFAAGGTAVGVADDMAKGMVDRFRALPMARSAFLFGRTTGDLILRAAGLAVMVICGLAADWRPHDGAVRTIAALSLMLLFGYAMNWVSTFVGLLTRDPETAESIGMALLFPLTFIANTFVPSQGMPPVLRAIAEWNPVSATTAAARQLFGNVNAIPASAALPLRHPVAASLGWSVLLLAMFVPLAIRRYDLGRPR
jgi:ABC-2 type transport system permease protein